MFSSGNVGDHAELRRLVVLAGHDPGDVVLLVVGNLERSRVGRAWVAIREDEDAAEIMGVPTFKFKLWAFMIGAGIGGMSGALYAGQVQYINPPGSTSSTRCCSCARW